MTNKYKPHIHILPEDDANRQIINGFLLNLAINERAIKVLDLAGGWTHARDALSNELALQMKQYPQRRVILAIDFDKHLERLTNMKQQIPDDLHDRVFILGTLSEPEDLKREFNGYENLGKLLSQDCVDNTKKTWGHTLLKHNQLELERLIGFVKPFLFH